MFIGQDTSNDPNRTLNAIRDSLLSIVSNDSQSARYLLSAIIQSVAAILTLIFTISLILLQMLYKQPKITRFFLKSGEMELFLIYSFSVIAVSVFTLSNIRDNLPLATLTYSLFLLSILLFIFIPLFIRRYWIFCAKFLDSENLLDIIKEKERKASQQMEMTSAIMDKALEEGNAKAIEKGCAYTRVIFEQAYTDSSFSTLEFILKNLKDLAKKSTKYGPETLEPFLNLFSDLMRFDLQKKAAYPYLRKIFDSTIFDILKRSLDEGNMETIEKGIAYTKEVFEQMYSEYSPPDMEFLFKNLDDMIKKSIRYDLKTLIPLSDLFVELMIFDTRKNAAYSYVGRIFESAEPIVSRIIQSNRKDVVVNYFNQLSKLHDSISDSQNFRAAGIYVDILRKNFQGLLQSEMKEKDEFAGYILFRIKGIFSDFTEFSREEIQEEDRRRQDTLIGMINNYCNIGYTLIHRREIYFLDEYLAILEGMYSRLLVMEQEKLCENLKYEFFLLLFKLGVFSLTENEHESVARVLSRDKVDRFGRFGNYQIYEDFIRGYHPEEYIGRALKDPLGVLKSIGKFSCERETIQFYLLIRSKALYSQMKESIRDTSNYSGSGLVKFLEKNSEWIFFEKRIPKKFSSKGKKVSFISDFIRKIQNFNAGIIEATGYSDFPDYMITVKIFEDRRSLFEDTVKNFTNDGTISREAFGGALEEFLRITIRFLNKVSEKWGEERERIEHSFPIVEERKERAKKQIKEALEKKTIFRKAVEWKKSDEQMLQKIEMLNEVLLKVIIEAKPLRDLPILAFFDNFGNEAAQSEDKEILNIILERNIKKVEAPPTISVETICRFLEELECETLVLITGRNISKDFRDSKQIQCLRHIDNAYEVTIYGRRRAIAYPSNLLKEETLIFAKDQFLEILYLEKEDIEIRFPEDNELDEEKIKEYYQTIVISQKRGLEFLDLTKAVLVKHASV